MSLFDRIAAPLVEGRKTAEYIAKKTKKPGLLRRGLQFLKHDVERSFKLAGTKKAKEREERQAREKEALEEPYRKAQAKLRAAKTKDRMRVCAKSGGTWDDDAMKCISKKKGKKAKIEKDVPTAREVEAPDGEKAAEKKPEKAPAEKAEKPKKPEKAPAKEKAGKKDEKTSLGRRLLNLLGLGKKKEEPEKAAEPKKETPKKAAPEAPKAGDARKDIADKVKDLVDKGVVPKAALGALEKVSDADLGTLKKSVDRLGKAVAKTGAEKAKQAVSKPEGDRGLAHGMPKEPPEAEEIHDVDEPEKADKCPTGRKGLACRAKQRRKAKGEKEPKAKKEPEDEGWLDDIAGDATKKAEKEKAEKKFKEAPQKLKKGALKKGDAKAASCPPSGTIFGRPCGPGAGDKEDKHEKAAEASKEAKTQSMAVKSSKTAKSASEKVTKAPKKPEKEKWGASRRPLKNIPAAKKKPVAAG
jgi:hypothetical protein